MCKNFPLNLNLKKYWNFTKQWELGKNIIPHAIASLGFHVKLN